LGRIHDRFDIYIETIKKGSSYVKAVIIIFINFFKKAYNRIKKRANVINVRVEIFTDCAAEVFNCPGILHCITG
jgi:uncharacterized Rmd1/YagE family protein